MSLLFSLSEKFSASAAPRLSRRGSHSARLSLRRVTLWPLTLFFVLLAAGSATAMPLDEYRARIRESVEEIDKFWEESDEETGTGAEYLARARVVLEKIKKLIPLEETIEWEGGRVRVNNSWLSEEVKNYERLPANDSSQRAHMLGRIDQRLHALLERLEELPAENKGAASAKEQEKARLAAILRREEYGEKPPGKSLWERFIDWLNSLLPSRSPFQTGQSSWLSVIAMILIFGVAAGLIGYAAWKLAPFFARLSNKSVKLEKRQARVVLGERLAPDETATDLLAQAETLARKGELRAAIRKGYIALLCELGDRKVLALAQHKTNHDYLRAVREKRPLLNQMQKLTASFENHWYGYVPATPDDWTNFRSGYQQTLKTASLLSDK
jgi:Domain of unknown function (DUF4129)